MDDQYGMLSCNVVGAADVHGGRARGLLASGRTAQCDTTSPPQAHLWQLRTPDEVVVVKGSVIMPLLVRL